MQTALLFVCLRLIRKFQTNFRDIYPRYPSRRNIGNDEQLIHLMSLSLHYGSHRAAPLLESVAGRKYHYPPAFHRLLWLLSKGLNVILIARSTEVVAYGSCGCRDFIPAAGLTFSRCCYSVVKILRDLDRSFFPFTL